MHQTGIAQYSPPILQSSCIQSTIGDSEILDNQSLDVDGNKTLDTIVIYAKDNIQLTVATDVGTANCKIALNEYLTDRKLIVGEQAVTIRDIELVELTGDHQPDIYVWLEKRNGGSRAEVALHAIYSLQNGIWQEALRGTQCLDASSFEIRTEQEGQPKILYFESDVTCDWPVSSRWHFTVMRWNGSRFMPAETGTVEIPFWRTMSWLDVVCCLPFAIAGIGLYGFAWILYRRRKTT